MAGSALQHVLTRQDGEEGRVVLVWKIFTEGEGEFAGLHSDEVGWAVVSAATSQGLSNPSTVLQNCMPYKPMHLSRTCEAMEKLFTRLILDARAYDALEAIVRLKMTRISLTTP
ncbi:hypothetical protein PC116_g22320 [Phytophthora cactorum]|nr:hypothetical protein PC114_g21855 [Phytophthora cactorum]KAG2981035.1 hypothetical protein PC119_g21133 [Phytophthora cactorum]KAG3022403.1 hypothetical protein PC120_g8165 [Phytophthora cactorum]KAG3136269.1 hypothetical protein C6341_g21458 [Phytophthora cactorum]KAG3157730.1 hypothetical protein PC128_g21610 [Phytophthora cactorum]